MNITYVKIQVFWGIMLRRLVHSEDVSKACGAFIVGIKQLSLDFEKPATT
jgi:hypothetical protein